MNILQIHTRYQQSGGEDTVVAAEAGLLQDAGHSVRLFEDHNRGGTAGAVQLAGALWNPRSARRLESTVKATRPDVAHLHNTWYAMSSSVIRRLRTLEVPTVMTLHNYRLTCANALLLRDGRPCELCVTGSPLQAVRYGCYRSRPETLVAAGAVALHRRIGTWAHNVDLFLALTDFMKSIMVRAGLPENKIVVKPNFTADPGPRIHPAEQSDTVIFVGRLSEEKGALRLLNSWSTAPPSGLRLKVVGDGPLRSSLEAQAPSSVEFLGYVPHDEVPALLRSARAMVFPSTWYEGLPMTIIEAFAAGLPVLANDLGAMASIVNPLGPHWLVPPTDATVADPWVDALARLTDSPAVQKASAQARATYEAAYTPQANLVALEDAYQRAIPNAS
jgi:glycosyltransferase involved in cell wall biosynthesis